MSSGCESFELLLLQHQSQLGVYAKSKELETEVPAVPRNVNRPVRYTSGKGIRGCYTYSTGKSTGISTWFMFGVEPTIAHPNGYLETANP